MIIGCIGLTLNILSAIVLHERSHDEATKNSSVDLGNRVQNENEHRAHRHVRSSGEQQHKNSHDLGITGVLLHILGDAANNIGVIIAAVVIWKTQYAARFYADPSVSMGIALMITMSSLPLIKKSGTILMQTMPDGVDLDDVKHDLETLPGVLAVHDLHIWSLNREKALASAHVMVSEEKIKSVDDFMHLANTVNECFHAYGIHSTTLQPEMVSSTTAQGSSLMGGSSHRRATIARASCQVGCRTVSCEEPTCCD